MSGVPGPSRQVPDEFAQALRELGLADDELAVLQVARLDYLKDHPTAVRAMGRVVRQANPGTPRRSGQQNARRVNPQRTHRRRKGAPRPG